MNIDIKKAEPVIQAVWERYLANLKAGKMRQVPGRSEYQYALQEAGVIPKTEQAARDFFFVCSAKHPFSRMVVRVERRSRNQ